MEWVLWAETIAFGPLGLKPWELEQLQPGQFYDLWDGYQWRHKEQENLQAYFTSCMMSVHTKHPVKTSDILKPLRRTVKKIDKKQDEEYLREQFRGVLE